MVGSRTRLYKLEVNYCYSHYVRWSLSSLSHRNSEVNLLLYLMVLLLLSRFLGYDAWSLIWLRILVSRFLVQIVLASHGSCYGWIFHCLRHTGSWTYLVVFFDCRRSGGRTILETVLRHFGAWGEKVRSAVLVLVPVIWLLSP